MASSDFWQRLSASVASSADWEAGPSASPARGTVRLWMALDILTVVGAAALATMYELHTGPVAGARHFWHGTLFHGSSKWILLGLLCGFLFSLRFGQCGVTAAAEKCQAAPNREYDTAPIPMTMASGRMLPSALTLLSHFPKSRPAMLSRVMIASHPAEKIMK
jgi:hypothetical protein